MRPPTENLLPHLPEFLDSLRVERRLAENTVHSYGRDLLLFGRFLRHLRRDSPLDVDHENLQAYLRWLADRGLSDRSRARNLSALRAFYRFMKLEGLSHYWGLIWVSLEDKQLEHATPDETVSIRQLLKGGGVRRSSVLRRGVLTKTIPR